MEQWGGWGVGMVDTNHQYGQVARFIDIAKTDSQPNLKYLLQLSISRGELIQ